MDLAARADRCAAERHALATAVTAYQSAHGDAREIRGARMYGYRVDLDQCMAVPASVETLSIVRGVDRQVVDSDMRESVAIVAATVATVGAGAPDVAGLLTALDGRGPQLLACRAATPSEAWAATVPVRVTFLASGEAQDAGVESEDSLGTAFDACIADVLQSLRLAGAGGPRTYRFSLSFDIGYAYLRRTQGGAD